MGAAAVANRWVIISLSYLVWCGLLSSICVVAEEHDVQHGEPPERDNAVSGALIQVKSDENLLWDAISHGDLSGVMSAVSHGADLDATTGPEMDTPLILAVMYGRIRIVSALLRYGADVDAGDLHGNTALSIAARIEEASYPRFDIMKALTDAGADVNAANVDGDTALHMASRQGVYSSVEILLRLRARVNVRAGDGSTPLFLAVSAAHERIVSLLLQAGADSNLGNDSDEMPIHIASTLSNRTSRAIAKMLVDFDADLNARTLSGDTPLHYAAFFGNYGVVKILLKYGASSSFEGSFTSSPLGVVCGCRVNARNLGLRQCPKGACSKPSEVKKIRGLLVQAKVGLDRTA